MNTTTANPIRVALLAGALLLSPTAFASDPFTSLGVVVDTRQPNAEGLRVLAVTPEGPAERMGIRTGDRLRTVNGIGFDRNASASMRKALSSGEQVRLGVNRGGRALVLSGNVATASGIRSGCGFVSDGDPAPRISQQVYYAEITQIDGRSTPLGRTNRHSMPSGRHALVVRELIDWRQLNNAQNRERSKQHRLQRGGFYKTLVVNVEPNTRYSIGARLKPGPISKQDIIDKTYWEPVVWKESAELCQ